MDVKNEEDTKMNVDVEKKKKGGPLSEEMKAKFKEKRKDKQAMKAQKERTKQRFNNHVKELLFRNSTYVTLLNELLANKSVKIEFETMKSPVQGQQLMRCILRIDEKVAFVADALSKKEAKNSAAEKYLRDYFLGNFPVIKPVGKVAATERDSFPYHILVKYAGLKFMEDEGNSGEGNYDEAGYYYDTSYRNPRYYQPEFPPFAAGFNRRVMGQKYRLPMYDGPPRMPGRMLPPPRYPGYVVPPPFNALEFLMRRMPQLRYLLEKMDERSFKCVCEIDNAKYNGFGPSKKAAKMNCAKDVCMNLFADEVRMRSAIPARGIPGNRRPPAFPTFGPPGYGYDEDYYPADFASDVYY